VTADLQRALRLVPVAAAAWLVAGITIAHPDTAPTIGAFAWSAALVVLVAAAVVRTRTTGRRLVVAVLALSLAAAAATHVAAAEPARDAAREVAGGSGRHVEVDAVVSGKVEPRPGGRVAFDAVTERIRAGEHVRRTAVAVTVWMDAGEAGQLDVGSAISVAGSVRDARPSDRALFVVSATEGRLSLRAPPPPILLVAGELRRGLVGSAADLPGPGSGLVPGLAVGDTSAVSDELDAAMKAASLSHLTAVSGANCALVVGIVFALCAALGAARPARVGASALALAGFVVLVTPEPSVVRAATMAGIAMAGLLLGRTGVGMAVLSLAVGILLALDPWLASSLGFALSACATASLLLLARPLAAGLARRMPRPLALALSVPLAAQLACGPLLVLIEPAVPTYGVVANLLAGPAAPAATIIGLLACLAGPVPIVADGLTALAWLPASWIAGTALTMTSLPFGSIPWVEGLAGAGLLAGVGAGVAVVISRPVGGRLRGLVGAGLAAVTGAVIGAAMLTTWAAPWTLPPEWAVLACDVGQGDALVLRSAARVAVVDTGPDPEAPTSCLARAGVDRVDLLVLTHFDADHAGAASVLAGRVGTLIHGPADADGRRTIAVLVAEGATAAPVHAGMTGVLGEARWRVLWPRAHSRAYEPGNDASVVIEIAGAGIPHSLLLGDLSASPQEGLVRDAVWNPPYDLVKVAHHGSADQYAELYRQARPAAAVITVGAGNTFGHPRAEVIDLLGEIGTHVSRTDRHGMVAVWATDEGLRVWRERDGVVPAD
jgi:competence protein ComEC